MSAIDVIHASNKIGGAKHMIPPIVWNTFKMGYQVHWCLHKGEIYGNPRNGVGLAAGHALTWAWGEKLGVKAASHALLIAIRLKECVDRKAHFSDAHNRWINSMRGNFPHYKLGQKEWTLSNSVSYQYIAKIVRATASLLYQGYRLSMHYCQAAETLTFNPKTQAEATNELFINIRKLLEDDCLAKKIEEHRDSLEALFPEKSATLISLLQSTLPMVTVAKKMSDASNGFVDQLFQRWTCVVLSLVGLDSKENWVRIPDPQKYFAAKE